MKKFFSFKFDTAKNATISILKLAGASLVGLIFLGLILTPFIGTEVNNEKDTTVEKATRK